MRDAINSNIRLINFSTCEVESVSGRGSSQVNDAIDACAAFPEAKMISIIIADPTAITSELLTQALSKQPEFLISGCPRNLEELVAIISDQAPDIALIRSTNQKGMFSPLTILNTIHSVSPSTRGIVLSSDLAREDVVSYFQAQARGILPAELTDFETLCKCIYSVNEGQIWASSKQLNYLIESLSGAKPLQIVNAEGEAVLSAREQEVLNLLSEGRSNRAMAEALNLSEHTIKNHLFHIFYKLGVSSRTEAILCAMRRRTLPQRKNAS